MSDVRRGRVLRGAGVSGARLLLDGPTEAQRTRIARDEVEAHQNGDRVLDMAVAQAAAIVSEAREKAQRAAAEAAREAAEAEQAKLAAMHLALRAAEDQRADLDRAISLATVLAERLIGVAVAHDPAVVAELARQALAEARGARRVRIEAHPLDAEALRRHVSSLAQGTVVDITENADLGRGSLCVHTDLGTLDAKLTPRLERLADALRDALTPPADFT
jgi:flagellar biosynthesis/type III secretory pathway protein FliH